MQLEFIQFWDLALLPQHRFSDLQAEGFSKGWGNRVANLAVLVPDGASKAEIIPKKTVSSGSGLPAFSRQVR